MRRNAQFCRNPCGLRQLTICSSAIQARRRCRCGSGMVRNESPPMLERERAQLRSTGPQQMRADLDLSGAAYALGQYKAQLVQGIVMEWNRSQQQHAGFRDIADPADLRVAEHVGDWRHLCRLAARCTAGVLDHGCPLQRATGRPGCAARAWLHARGDRSVAIFLRPANALVRRPLAATDCLPTFCYSQFTNNTFVCRRAISGQPLPAQIACWLLANSNQAPNGRLRA